MDVWYSKVGQKDESKSRKADGQNRHIKTRRTTTDRRNDAAEHEHDTVQKEEEELEHRAFLFPVSV